MFVLQAFLSMVWFNPLSSPDSLPTKVLQCWAWNRFPFCTAFLMRCSCGGEFHHRSNRYSLSLNKLFRMASFLRVAAFSIMCFGSGDTFTVVMMSITWFTLFVLLLWYIMVVRDNKPLWYAWPFNQLWSWAKPDGVMAGEGRLRPSRSETYKV
jgi:hypothetical protein